MYCTADIALVIEERAIIANFSAFYQNLKRVQTLELFREGRERFEDTLSCLFKSTLKIYKFKFS